MTKILAIASAATLAFAPAIASAESPLFLNSTKSSGNLSAPVVEDVVIIPEVMPATGISPLLLAGLGLAAVAGIAALANDDDNATTTTLRNGQVVEIEVD